MSPDINVTPSSSNTYQITVEGKIDSSWSDWFACLSVASYQEPDGMFVTTIHGVLNDQAALRGLLNRLWDLNLEVVSLQRVDTQNINLE
jgi:hypothetical protein